MLLPGQQAVAHFNVVRGGVLSEPDDVYVRAYRNDQEVAVTATLTNPFVGYYIVTFDVPVDWKQGDAVFIALVAQFARRQAMVVKPAGILSSPSLALLDADQVRDGNQIRYYRRGTNKTELIGTQIQTGDPCSDQVTLTWQ